MHFIVINHYFRILGFIGGIYGFFCSSPQRFIGVGHMGRETWNQGGKEELKNQAQPYQLHN